MPLSSHGCNNCRYSYFRRKIWNGCMLTTLKPSSEHDRKQILRLLQRDGDQLTDGCSEVPGKSIKTYDS